MSFKDAFACVLTAGTHARYAKEVLAEAFLAVPEGTTEGAISDAGAEAAQLVERIDALEKRLAELVVINESRRKA